jgi:hypothetical protein
MARAGKKQDKNKEKTAPDTGDELTSQAMALAEQLGQIAGTIKGTADAWLDRASLTDQLTRVRDEATQLLSTLADRARRGRETAQPTARSTGARAASGNMDLVHAPGKRHRKPPPSKHGVRKSDETIAKLKTAEAARQRRKSYA